MLWVGAIAEREITALRSRTRMKAAFPIRWQCDNGRRAAHAKLLSARTRRTIALWRLLSWLFWCIAALVEVHAQLVDCQSASTLTHTRAHARSKGFNAVSSFARSEWTQVECINNETRIRREKEIKLSLYNLFKTNYVLAWRAELRHTKIADEANNASAGESTSVWSWRLLRTHDPHNFGRLDCVDWKLFAVVPACKS